MATHHTKDKGDLGVAKAHVDLVAQGFVVLFPASAHTEFDLVAYRDGAFHRIQVKYRSATTGSIQVQFRSTWADRNGTHTSRLDKSAVDFICIYCPESDECYYVRPDDFRHSVTLRIRPAKNGQAAGVSMATEFRTIPA